MLQLFELLSCLICLLQGCLSLILCRLQLTFNLCLFLLDLVSFFPGLARFLLHLISFCPSFIRLNFRFLYLTFKLLDFSLQPALGILTCVKLLFNLSVFALHFHLDRLTNQNALTLLFGLFQLPLKICLALAKLLISLL